MSYKGHELPNMTSRVSEEFLYLQNQGLPMLEGLSDHVPPEVELVAYKIKNLFGLQR